MASGVPPRGGDQFSRRSPGVMPSYPGTPTTAQADPRAPLMPSSSTDSASGLLPPRPQRQQRPNPPPGPGYVPSGLNPASTGSSPRGRMERSEESAGSRRSSMVINRLGSGESGFASAAQLAPPHHRFSHVSSTGSVLSLGSDSKYPGGVGSTLVPALNNGAFTAYQYDPVYEDGPEPDDRQYTGGDMHDKISGLNARGCLNVTALVALVSAVVTLFTAYPIVSFVKNEPFRDSVANNVQVNGTGQVTTFATIPKLVDPDTPDLARTRTGYDGQEYELVFSDEFNMDNRTFWPGDDPFWEAVDLYYWATKDMEWYDPLQVSTGGGYLRIKLEQVADGTTNHNLNLRSGMLQSWNKFCFTGGYIEISAQLPGQPNVAGYWPGAWTMGNLGRPGYGATADGLWPYTYDTCDRGTLANQTNPDKQTPITNFNLPEPPGRPQYNDELSWLPGQRTSACTCAGEEHPGPTNRRGRGVPEIDILEAEKDKYGGPGGSVSQSAQFAPFNNLYEFGTNAPDIVIHTPDRTVLNNYKGSPLQQAVSALTTTPDAIYGAGDGQQQFGTFGFEYWPDPVPANSFITWVSADINNNNQAMQTYTMQGTSVGPDETSQIGQRLISPEPMSIVFNLAVSTSFQAVDLANMVFPAEFLVDYVRVYQRKGQTNVGCDPPDYPTAKYINDHPAAYTNPNYTTWESAGYPWPKNSIIDGCTG